MKYNMDAKGLVFIEDLTLEEWQEIGNTLRGIEHGRMFWIGDWINYGEARYGEKYSQALSHTDYALNTLQRAASVCKRIPYDMRRPGLAFEQHALIASLEEKQQKKAFELAEKNEETVVETRERVNTLKGKPPKTKKEFTEWITEWMKDEWQEDQPEGSVTMPLQTFIDRMGMAWEAGKLNK